MLSLVLSVALTLAPNDNSLDYPEHIKWAGEHQVQSRAAVLAINALAGCIRAVIGSDFKACPKGMLGGAIQFTGQLMAVNYAWKNGQPTPIPALGKLTFDLGTSVIDNAMLDSGMFSSYTTDLGPFSVTFGERAGIKMGYYAAFGLYAAIASGDKLNSKTSLFYLTPVFTMKDEAVMIGDVVYYSAGTATGNTIRVNSRKYNNTTLGHELIHTMQWSSGRWLNEGLLYVTKRDEMDVMTWVFNRWNAGQDMMWSLGNLPRNIDSELYFFSYAETEAYYMQK